MADEQSKAVLITGCSSGIGHATAKLLADEGRKVYATARRVESIEDLKQNGCETLALDVTEEASMQAAVSTVEEAEGAVGVVVCVNMLLFADEVRRVLADGGLFVWVNSIGERTPIHLSAEQVAASLGDDVEVVASRCGWGTWAVARI